jgi:hypothetical protein
MIPSFARIEIAPFSATGSSVIARSRRELRVSRYLVVILR